MKRPYRKLITEIEPIKVYEVDGRWVRERLGEEFMNFGQHYRFSFIPENEFWIDHEVRANEQKYFIDHLLVEHRLMAAGASYDEAIEKADKVEKRERVRSRFKAGLKRLIHLKETIDRVHQELLESYSGQIKVWIVDGKLVRNLFDIDFTEGGHDLVYNFIPNKEVWIDDDLLPEERKFVILHELRERNLMAQGWGYDEDDINWWHRLFNPKKCHPAHFSARSVEYFCRRYPEETEGKLKEEMRTADRH